MEMMRVEVGSAEVMEMMKVREIMRRSFLSLGLNAL